MNFKIIPVNIEVFSSLREHKSFTVQKNNFLFRNCLHVLYYKNVILELRIENLNTHKTSTDSCRERKILEKLYSFGLSKNINKNLVLENLKYVFVFYKNLHLFTTFLNIKKIKLCFFFHTRRLCSLRATLVNPRYDTVGTQTKLICSVLKYYKRLNYN